MNVKKNAKFKILSIRGHKLKCLPDDKFKEKRREIGSHPVLGKLERYNNITSGYSKEVVTLQMLPNYPVFKMNKNKFYINLHFHVKSSINCRHYRLLVAALTSYVKQHKFILCQEFKSLKLVSIMFLLEMLGKNLVS